jgi:hypothetical protein
MKLSILSVLLFPIVCHGLVIDMRDNFENWTATTLGPGNIYSNDRAAGCYLATEPINSFMLPSTGNRACKTEDGSATQSIAEVQWNWGSPANTLKYHKISVYFPTTFFSSFTANTFLDFYRVQITSGGGIYPYPLMFEVGLTPTSTNILRMRVVGLNKVTTISSCTIIPVEGRWYEIEFISPQGVGNNTVFRWWVEGQEQTSVTANMTGLANWAAIEFGIHATYIQQVPTSFKGCMYMDDLMISDSFIPFRRLVKTNTSVP